ncbi:conserved hypothetical protein [Burkholderia pseudomallei Pasteur 52237]|nr:conserved hypothetical protein [Burkholderia pseudomallei Pasteur 52237]
MFVLLCLRHEAVGRKLVSPKPEISHGGLLVKFDRVTPAPRRRTRASTGVKPVECITGA